ncbi:MAG: pilus assembly protein N-terminal domain-containing protein, partial [Pirellulaceae bacterium]
MLDELITAPPSDEALAKARRFVDAEVSAELQLPVILGRPKILQLADTPTRIFLADDEIATAEVLDQQTGRQLAIVGREVGSTVLAIWFESPDAPGGEELLSYLVSVSDDPARSRRFEQLLADLEKEINRAFPNSVVKLGYVGAEVLVRGKAKDIDEATQILRIVSRSLPTASTEEKLAALEGLGAGSVEEAAFQTPR